MKYNVKYSVTTKSRYGAYVYNGSKEIEAENEADCKSIVKSQAGNWYGFKRFSVSIKSINQTNPV